MIAISLEGGQTVRADLVLRSTQLDRGAARAINRSLLSGRTVLVRGIASDTGLKQAVVRDAINTRQANASSLEGTIGALTRRIALINFNAKDTGFNKGTGRRSNARIPGVRGRVGRGVTYRFGSDRRTISNAFIATMDTGHTGVFVRKAKSRLPIRELFGPSIAHVGEKYRAAALARAQAQLVTNLQHELSRVGSDDTVTVVDDERAA